jgi:periplasmic divalent cation tolerance protein
MYSVIYITAKDIKEAKAIAGKLLEERLIACANCFPVTSTFRWEGKVEEDTEVAMICKTVAENVPGAIKRVKELHSYDTPCITSWNIDTGHEKYLEWVKNETATKS